MNRLHDNRWEQLRAVEADLLCPIPPDPTQTFPEGWCRAAELSENDWYRLSTREKSVSPPPVEPQPEPRRAMRRMPVQRMNRAPVQIPERRPLRQMNGNAVRRPETPPQRQQQNQEVDVSPEIEQQAPRRRAISPTQLPGVRAIPKDYNRFFRGLLAPGEYFVKSQTRYLGPFEEMPTEETVPENDDYIVLQRMGRLPDSGKSIFRQVGTLST